MKRRQQLVYEEDGEVKALVAAEVTFYLAQRNGAEAGFVRAYEIAMERLAAHITWCQSGGPSRRVTPNALKRLPNRFSKKGMASRDDFEITFISGRTGEDVGPWGLKFALFPNEATGVFHMNRPMDALLRDTEDFVALIESLAEALVFRSGHAGYGIQYDEGDMLDEREQQMSVWCNRYLGLDCNDLAVMTEYTRDAIKGAAWLTLLDHDFCTKLGGIAALRKKLATPVSVKELSHGALIRAGAIPLLGDPEQEQEQDMRGYRIVAKTVQPLRVRDPEFSLPAFEDDPKKTQKWLTRFEK